MLDGPVSFAVGFDVDSLDQRHPDLCDYEVELISLDSAVTLEYQRNETGYITKPKGTIKILSIDESFWGGVNYLQPKTVNIILRFRVFPIGGGDPA